MKKLSYFLALAVAAMAITSCGSSKKLEAANTENARLQKMLSEQSQTIASSEKLVGQLKTENATYSKEAADCRQVKEAIAQKFENLNKNLAAQGTSIEEIRSHVAESIAKFQDAGATVTYKSGMIHITFEDNFFFKSGNGKNNPTADNSTVEGRAKNRRIEIIFNPDLSRIWDLIDK